MVEVDISKNITTYRKMKNLTIKELANLTGVTPSLLSQIEKGTANPSINTLKQVSYALDIPLFNFFINDDSNESLVVRSDNRRKIVPPNENSLAYELLTPNLKGSIEFSLLRIPPHKLSSEDSVSHNGEEVAYVSEGSVVLYLMNSVIELSCGDSVKIPPHTDHKWENTSEIYCEVIFAVTPPTF